MVLVTVNIVLSFPSLVGSGLLLRSLARPLDINPGFNSDNVLSLEFSLIYRKAATQAQPAVSSRKCWDECSQFPVSSKRGASTWRRSTTRCDSD